MYKQVVTSYRDLILAPLKQSDLAELVRWPKFENSDLLWANFQFNSKEMQDRWMSSNVKPWIHWYSVRDSKNMLIARCTITETEDNDIVMFGIVVRPDYIGKGYGQQITKMALLLILNHTSVKTVWLESKADNEQAIRLWCRMGFHSTGYHYRRDQNATYHRFIGFQFLLEDLTNESEIKFTV
ncbi:MAG: GNAT family N-acetyltransferase [Candidatus Heimdallarchaeota archaeon]|nr:GNAT family N-acetyltransferase [Candidatus Heimdallarchaeota archaeon]MDH5646289.1 GNAT family N-acetyltransferase [Candidatus Heimdallarchaeota archaeon]